MRTLLLIFMIIFASLLISSAHGVLAHIKSNTNYTNQIINEVN